MTAPTGLSSAMMLLGDSPSEWRDAVEVVGAGFDGGVGEEVGTDGSCDSNMMALWQADRGAGKSPKFQSPLQPFYRQRLSLNERGPGRCGGT